MTQKEQLRFRVLDSQPNVGDVQQGAKARVNQRD